jgi:hypothetical protein
VSVLAVILAATAVGTGVMRSQRAALAVPSEDPASTAAAAPAETAPELASAAPAETAPELASAAPATATDVDWRAVLADLDARRREAIAAGSIRDLAESVDPAGAAWTDDAALVERVRASGAHLTGGRLVTEDVRVLRRGSTRAVLRVRDRRTAYEVVVGGRTTAVAGRAARWWTVTLSATPSFDTADTAWRVRDVEPAAAQ